MCCVHMYVHFVSQPLLQVQHGAEDAVHEHEVVDAAELLGVEA